MLRSRRRYIPLLAAALAAASIAGCGGDDIPGNAVVKVDDESVTKTEFNKWMRIAALRASGGNKAQAVIPDPPDYTKCVQRKRTSLPKPAKGQPRTTDKQLKEQCKTEYEGYRDQVLSFLISARWLEGEAEDQDVKVTDADVRKSYEDQKKQSFPKEADFQKFLRESGMTVPDLLFNVRIDLLSNKIRDKVTKNKDKVTNAQIAQYYEKNKARFAQPERRDLRIVLTKTRARADQAMNALESGQSFSAVAKRFSIDEASKNQGGVLLSVAKGQQEKALDDAVFAAGKGQLKGPIKTQFGWYVFKVQKVTKASQQSLSEARTTIRSILASEGQQKALNDFVEDFRKKWRERTKCRDGFKISDCENGPKETTNTSTAPPGAGGGAPTPQPQTGAPPGTGQPQP